ncbi:MAG: hypothetical protein D6E12_12175 [Desulfovibrio sp.]|nr:MAG: hypothetical protein D6E12_12175 [Desulfovibrio sp.]
MSLRPSRSCLALSLVVVLALGATACSFAVKSATQPLMRNLAASVMKQRDLELVRLGAPAYLMFMDGLIEGRPDDPDTLLMAAKLYSAYAGAFAEADSEQALLLTDRARDYAFRALSLRNETFSELHREPAAQFGPVPETMEPGDEEYLLTVINAWAAYIMARPGSWDDIADLPKIQALAERLLELDETYYYGSPHMIMGVIKTLLPEAAGGKPDEARAHFERALEISDGKFLQAQVMFASRYCRMVYDRELHDQLLDQVMKAEIDQVEELTLANVLAKKRAEALLADADTYF